MKNKKLVSVVLAASMMASTGMTAFATAGELQKEQNASVVCEASKVNTKIRFKPNEFNWNRIKEGKKYDFDFKVFDSELSTTEKEQFFESINVVKEGKFYVITINCKSAKIPNTPFEIDVTGIELYYFDDLKAKEPITIDAVFDYSNKVGRIKLPEEAIGYRPYRVANDFDNLVRIKINTNAKDKLFGPMADEYAEYDSHLAFSVLNDAPVVNKTELEEAIKDAKAIISNRDDYAPAGVTFMEKKLTEAESVFSNDDATEDEVNTATANLRKAIDRVYKKADLTDLIAEQNRAKVTIDDYSHLYTEASIDLYKATYDRARLLVYEFTSGKRPNLKQKEVDNTLNNLKNSREQLKKKSEAKLDVNNLEDGKYELGSYLWHELRDKESMGNSALKHTAYLTVKDGKYTLTIGGRGMTVGTMTGYLDAYRIVTNGLNPREDKDAEYTEVEVKQDGLDCTADIVLTNTDNVTEYYYGSIKVYAKMPDGSIVYPMGTNWVNSRLRLSWDGIQVIELDRIKEVEAARPGAIEEIQNYRSDEEFGEEETEKLEAIKKNTINLINKVEYMESLNTALENGKAAMDMVKSESYKKEEADRQAELE